MPKQTKNGGKNGAEVPGAGGNDDNDDDGDQEITPALRDLIVRTVNSAVTGQVGRKLPTMIAEAVGPAIESAMGPVLERLGGAGQGQQQPGQGQQGQQQGGQGAGAVSPEVKAMQDQLAALQKQLKERDSAAAAAEQRARETTRDSTLSSLLAKHGVDQNRMRGAVAVLRESMAWSKDANNGAGGWVYKAKRDGYEEDLDVAAGVKEWAGTDEGKAYVSAQQRAGGAGTRVGAGAGARQAPADPKAAKAERIAKAEQTLNTLIQSAMGDGGTIELGE